jgi:hypothetical protein
MKDVTGAETAVKAAVLPRMVQVKVGIITAGIMPHPAVAIYMRSFGMSGLIAKTVGLSLGLDAIGLRWSGTRRRGATERGWTTRRWRAGVETALRCAAPAGLSASFLSGEGYRAKEQQHA